jgi:hypothetical protein
MKLERFRSKYLGTKWKTKNFGELEIIGYDGTASVTVRFLSTGCVRTTSISQIKEGRVRDYLARTILGVGFVGGDKYTSKSDKCAYSKWVHMMNRCYCESYQIARPTYKGIVVCDEWHNFQNFAQWYYENIDNSIISPELDKDILSEGMKIYSPLNCKIIDRNENIEHAKAKHFLLISPSGDEVAVYNLSKFCRDNDLEQRNMSAVVNKKRRSHKGWTIKSYK